MWEFVQAGGWLMLPLILCSITTIVISIERYVRLQGRYISPRETLAFLLDHPVLDDMQQQQHFASPMGKIFQQGYLAKQQRKTAEFAQIQMQIEASVQLLKLEKNINFLGTIGTIAPLLGLLGTVLGIIEAFLAVNAAGGMSDPAMLANGVSKALITTAAGMMVAIPALIAYRYYQRVIVELMVDMEQQATLYHTVLFH